MNTHFPDTAKVVSRRAGMPDAAAKYRPYPPVDLPDRTWPGQAILRATSQCR